MARVYGLQKWDVHRLTVREFRDLLADFHTTQEQLSINDGP